MLLSKEFDILVSSNPAIGAKHVSTDGSTFTIRADGGLGVPPNAKNVNVSVVNADFWNNDSNVVEGKNNIRFTFSTGGGSIAVPPGLYDGTTIGPAIISALHRSDATGYSDNEFGLVIQANDATGVMEVIMTKTSVPEIRTTAMKKYTIGQEPPEIYYFDTLDLEDIGLMMGFTTPIVPTGPSYMVESVIEPMFNTLNYWLIQSDIVGQGIPVNGQYDSVIAKITSDVESNLQVLYEPINPSQVPAINLTGSAKSSYRFSLLSDSFKHVNTRGEFWSAQIRISYSVIEVV